MTAQETITAALLSTFNADQSNPQAVASAAASLVVAFADLVRGPAPVVGELVASELVADETPALILAELRKHTTLLEVLAKQGDMTLCTATAPATGSAASGLPG